MMLCNRYALIATLLLLVLRSWVSGQDVLTPIQRGMTYQQIRTAHEQAMLQGGTQQQKLESIKDIVRAGPYGERGLQQIFKNFEGPNRINAGVSGVQKTARLLASTNPAQRKGAARTIVYATVVDNDPRFTLQAVNELIRQPNGRVWTDRDLVFEHKATGQKWGMEIKEVSPASQRSNLQQYKTQLNKMAAEYRETGRLQAFVNRREIIPELRAYANQLGILVFENAMTGKTALEANSGFKETVLKHIDRMSQTAARTKVISGGVGEAGVGAWLVYESAQGAWFELNSFLGKEERSLTDYLRLGQQGSALTLGGAAIMHGGISIAARFSQAVATSSHLAAISRATGPIGLVALVALEGFSVTSWLNGDLTDRHFYTGQAEFIAGLGGGIAGGWTGAWAGAGFGAVIGSSFGPAGTGIGAGIGGTLGALGGGIGGGMAGAWLGGRGVNVLYQFKEEKDRVQLRDFIYRHYGAR